MGPGPRPPLHSVPPPPQQQGAQKWPLSPFPQSWGRRWGCSPSVWHRPSVQGQGHPLGVNQRVAGVCVLQDSWVLRGSGASGMPRVMPVGRSCKVPLDLNRRLLIRGLSWCRGKRVLAETAGPQAGRAGWGQRQACPHWGTEPGHQTVGWLGAGGRAAASG